MFGEDKNQKTEALTRCSHMVFVRINDKRKKKDGMIILD
jgi:hypothetical protein